MAPLLTKKELAELLKVSTRTIDRYVKKHLLSPIRIGGIVRFEQREAEGLLARQQW